MELIQYKCPNCGGPLKFDPKTGMHTCEYCRSRFTEQEVDEKTNIQKQAGGNAGPASATSDASIGSAPGGDASTGDASIGNASNGNASTGHTSTASAPGEDASIEDAKEYTCPSCGATIITDSTTAATFCYYCHNPVVLSGRLTGDYKPDYVVPFKISKEKALEIFEKWIARKKYVPKAFYDKSQIEKFTGIYFPYLLYTCDVTGSLDTQGTRTRVYMEGTFECTEKSVFHVVRDGNMPVQHVLRNALKKANAALADGVLPFTFGDGDMKPFNMSYLSGFFAEKRDIGREDLREEMREEVRSYAVSQLAGSVADYKDVTVDQSCISIANEKWEYALMPVWSLTYNDNGKIYYFSVNGQTGKTIGELPVDRGKLIRTFLLIFVPMMLAILALFYFVF